MLGREDADRLSGGGGGGPGGAASARKTYLRSVSWSDRSPSKPNPRPPSNNNKARLCLPPLQPLAVTRRNMEEWPKAGSDDLGVWPNIQTPRGANGEPLKNSENPPREFQFKRDKLAFFDKECSKIADHIYLGSDAVAKNRETLRQNGITHVLNCVGFVSPEYFKSDLVYKTLWLQDSPSEDITSILYDVFDYFEDVREQGGRVLVHCCQGVSRSTSLVIAYLMWREGQSFEDAFQYVKAARGVTNPNMGFACQLLQCQKRVNVIPASPGPVIRMYRMAPHSPYDPLHLVPKLLCSPSAEALDSRGAFILHIPSAIYVWVGKNCKSVMLKKAMAAAAQVIRYERAEGPIEPIKEGEEPFEFWDALANRQLSPDEDDGLGERSEKTFPAKQRAVSVMDFTMVGSRKVAKYDLDFEIFHKALAGGVVPPFSVSNTDSETCLPARENGWDKLRHKFASGEMKEFVSSTKLKGDCTSEIDASTVIMDIYAGSECSDQLDDPRSPSTPSSHPCGSPDSFSCFLSSSPDRVGDAYSGEGQNVTCIDPLLSPVSASPCSSPDSFSRIPVGSPIFSSKSPTLSPSNSDYSSSFTFSPSSSNWSDLPYSSSRQPSPSGLETTDQVSVKDVDKLSSSLQHKETPPPREAFSANHVQWLAYATLPSKGGTPSIAERRGSNPPPKMLLPSVNEQSRSHRNLVRSWSFSLDDLKDDVMKDVIHNQSDTEDDLDLLVVDSEHILTPKDGNEMHMEVEDRKSCDLFNICSCTDKYGR